MIALDILFADLENPEQDTALGAAIARADNVLLPVSFRINEKVPPLRAAFVDALAKVQQAGVIDRVLAAGATVDSVDPAAGDPAQSDVLDEPQDVAPAS